MQKIENSLKDLSVDDMLALRDAVDARLSEIAAAEVATLESRLQRLKGYVGDTKSSIAAPKKPKARIAKMQKKKPGKRGPKRGQKVAPKFRDPESGKTWTGRGLTPLWLKELEAKGNKRSKYAI